VGIQCITTVIFGVLLIVEYLTANFLQSLDNGYDLAGFISINILHNMHNSKSLKGWDITYFLLILTKNIVNFVNICWLL